METEQRFDADLSSLREARQFVADALRDMPENFVEDVTLLVSELATNSVTHARSPFTLRLLPDIDALRIEVTDRGDDLPRKRSPRPDEPFGRGLRVVDALSESWGVGLSPEGGKTIWAVVPLPAAVADNEELAPSYRRRVEFDDLVPRWLFGVKGPVRRALVGLGSGAIIIPFFASIENPETFRPGAPVATVLVVVTCISGSVGALTSGALLLGALLFFGVLTTDAIAEDTLGFFNIAGLVVLIAAMASLATRLERSVDQVRRLDVELRAETEAQAEQRRRAERVASQAESVLSISAVLAAVHGTTELAQAALTEMNIPTQPTFGVIVIVEDNHMRVIASRGGTDAMVDSLRDVDLSTSAWLQPVLGGEMFYVEDREEFAVRFPDAGVLRIFDSGAWLVAPFHSEGTLGLLSLHFTEPQPLKDFRLYFTLVSELLGTSLERARSEEHLRRQHSQLEQAFEERDRIARTLSTSLLPPVLPRLGGFAVSGWLVPASGDQLAGDFYDLFAVEDGWVAVLGDVCGKGAEAAAVTSLARYAARAAALENPNPAHVARVANRALVADPSDLFCTAAIVRYSHIEGAVDVTLAGHLQARLVVDGDVTRIGRFGAALGLASERPFVDRYHLAPGAMVVLFTDGLVERDPGFGERELDRFLAEAKGRDAAELSAELRNLVDRLAPRHPDDVAVLVLERTT